MNSDTSARTHAKDSKGVKGQDELPRLTDDDIYCAISYLDEGLDGKEYCANVGVVILLMVNVIAFLTLFFHVANS